jgi:hypothetical protein
MGLAALSIYSSGKADPLLETHAASFGDYTVTFDQVAKLLNDPGDRPLVLKEFNNMLMRTTLKESFEHVKEYCQNTSQYPLLKKQNWYEFARIIRNFLSHNCRFIFNKFDKDRLPIKWHDLVITEDLHGQGLGDNTFGNVETWELFQELEQFVKNELK